MAADEDDRICFLVATIRSGSEVWKDYTTSSKKRARSPPTRSRSDSWRGATSGSDAEVEVELPLLERRNS